MSIITDFVKKLPAPIQTKFNNYTAKAKADASILSLQRVAKNSRVSLPYRVIIDNELTLDMLSSFYEGVCVLLENNDYFELLEKDDPLSVYLIENIGGDNVVSSIVCIYSIDGNSGSSLSKQFLEKIKPIIVKNNWIPIERKNKKSFNVCQGNDKLIGHYYYDISGGSTTSETSHTYVDKIPQEFQLFNHFSDYASSKTIERVKHTLVFYMLHCYDIKKYIPEDLVLELLSKLKPDLTLYTYCVIESELYCPITNIKISIDFFLKNNDDLNCIHLCHNEAVVKNKIKYDNSCILTAFRPDNLFFGTKNGNLQMQDFSIPEFKQEQFLIFFRQLRLKMCDSSTQTE